MFEFGGSGRVFFGWGRVKEVVPAAMEMGAKFLVVTGGNKKRACPVTAGLEKRGLEFHLCRISGEPDAETVSLMASDAVLKGCDTVIAMGGGSVLDAGKAIAALMTNPGDVEDYLEVVGKGLSIENPPAPLVAVPTTSGTGSEVTKNAVLTHGPSRTKVSMRSPMMVPDLSVVDPELTVSLPADITAWTGLDAFTQLLEAFVSVKANPLSDGVCREGIMRAARSLERAVAHGSDRRAREDMSVASLFGGFALAHAGLGAVHGFAGPMGGMYGISHGLLCGSLLAAVMRVNVEELEKSGENGAALEKYREIAVMVTGNASACALDGVNWIEGLCRRLKVPHIADLGIDVSDHGEIVKKARCASSMKGNPVRLSGESLMKILSSPVVK